jgi:hypothetical protein
MLKLYSHVSFKMTPLAIFSYSSFYLHEGIRNIFSNMCILFDVHACLDKILFRSLLSSRFSLTFISIMTNELKKRLNALHSNWTENCIENRILILFWSYFFVILCRLFSYECFTWFKVYVFKPFDLSWAPLFIVSLLR